jgi:lipopolysaccharide transport system permease protein
MFMRPFHSVVYTPETPLRHPLRLLSEMLRDLAASRELAWRLFVRDLSAQYRQSILGYFWVFIPPLVASLPFIFLKSQGIVAVQATPIPYPAYALVGTVIWQVFVDAFASPLKSVTAAKSMLTKINFPREAILLSGLGQVLFSFFVRLVLLIAVFVTFKIVPPLTALLFPLGILALIMGGFMLGIFITPFGMLYGDVQQTIPVFTMFLMFLTPVLYPPPQHGIASALARYNPLSPLVLATRDWITTGPTLYFRPFCIVSATAFVLLFVGWVAYRLALPHIIGRIGN